jgi:DNA repair exonuclease SbcCD nuclease subunit
VRALFTGDWHSDASTYGVSRHDDVVKAVKQTVEAAVSQKVDLYCFGGDLCDPDDAIACLRALKLAMWAAGTLARAGIPQVWQAGNHDVFEDGSGDTTLTPLYSMASTLAQWMWVVEIPTTVRVRNCSPVYTLPFTASSHPYDPAKELRTMCTEQETNNGAHGEGFVMSHLAFPGIQPGEETTEMPRGREVVFPVDELARLRPDRRDDWLVAQFHYHRRQTLRLPFATVLVPGSAARLAFGEEDNTPGFLLVDL